MMAATVDAQRTMNSGALFRICRFAPERAAKRPTQTIMLDRCCQKTNDRTTSDQMTIVRVRGNSIRTNRIHLERPAAADRSKRVAVHWWPTVRQYAIASVACDRVQRAARNFEWFL